MIADVVTALALGLAGHVGLPAGEYVLTREYGLPGLREDTFVSVAPGTGRVTFATPEGRQAGRGHVAVAGRELVVTRPFGVIGSTNQGVAFRFASDPRSPGTFLGSGGPAGESDTNRARLAPWGMHGPRPTPELETIRRMYMGETPFGYEVRRYRRILTYKQLAALPAAEREEFEAERTRRMAAASRASPPWLRAAVKNRPGHFDAVIAADELFFDDPQLATPGGWRREPLHDMLAWVRILEADAAGRGPTFRTRFAFRAARRLLERDPRLGAEAVGLAERAADAPGLTPKQAYDAAMTLKAIQEDARLPVSHARVYAASARVARANFRAAIAALAGPHAARRAPPGRVALVEVFAAPDGGEWPRGRSPSGWDSHQAVAALEARTDSRDLIVLTHLARVSNNGTDAAGLGRPRGFSGPAPDGSARAELFRSADGTFPVFPLISVGRGLPATPPDAPTAKSVLVSLGSAIEAASAKPAAVQLTGHARREGNAVAVAVTIAGRTPWGARLHVALVERELWLIPTSRWVGDAECPTHRNVVRALFTPPEGVRTNLPYHASLPLDRVAREAERFAGTDSIQLWQSPPGGRKLVAVAWVEDAVAGEVLQAIELPVAGGE